MLPDDDCMLEEDDEIPEYPPDPALSIAKLLVAIASIACLVFIILVIVEVAISLCEKWLWLDSTS